MTVSLPTAATSLIGSARAESIEATPPLSASQKRAQNPDFVPTWSLQALWPKLPLLFPIAPNLPPSPKARYQSRYRYPGPDALLDPTYRATLSDFEIALYLIDFAPLERVLAQIYVPSRKGQVPYHPVSLFLSVCLRREQNLKWRKLARLLASKEHGAGWRKLFGFGEGRTPSASTLRSFYYTVGSRVFDDLCANHVALLRQNGLFPERSTYPGDPAERGISVTQDGMLHPARSRPSCQLAEDVCYQPLPSSDSAGSSDQSGTCQPTGRFCRARKLDHEGCACDTAACREQCKRASCLDREARFIHYDGHNQKRKHPSEDPAKSRPGKGVDLFGYRSVADRALDDRWAIAWNLQTGLYSANTDERTIFQKRLKGLKAKYPDLSIGEWLDDSAVGYDECLSAIWELGALRMVDIRAHPTDEDPEVCLRRGYDGQGRPLCPHGYALRSNGYDYERRRAKYVCDQVCRRRPLREGEVARPIEGCPYLDRKRPLGLVVNVGRALPDGSLRLAREIPYGSEAWKARYARRNFSESRNAQLESIGLKRLGSHGLDHNTRDAQLADSILNLRTLGRLVREATNLRVA